MSSAAESRRTTEAEALADEAYALVQVQPRAALALAERAVTAASREGLDSAKVAALYALAWAQHELGDPRTIATAKAGIRLGERIGDRRSVALLRRRLAVSYAFAGQMRAARREIDAAVESLSGLDRAQSEVFRLLIHGRADAADPERDRRILADAAKALRALRRAGDEIWEARLRFNRALLLINRGELDAAEEDLRLAQALYAGAGAEVAAIDAAIATAEIYRLRGELLSCLGLLDEIEASLPAGYVAYNLPGRRAAALAQARLLPEARAATEAYVDLLARTGRGDEAAVIMLDLAGIAMLSRDAAGARLVAEAATRSFAARREPVNAANARVAGLRARVLEGSVRPASVRSGLQAAAVLESAGWRRDALRARLVAARAAIALGSTVRASRQLELAGPLARLGTVTDRIELCHARALLLLEQGDARRAEKLLDQGLRELEEYRAAIGAIELRATASGIGADLSQLGLDLAVRSRDPARILDWAERLRGNTLRLPIVRPPPDPRLRALQAELRRLAAGRGDDELSAPAAAARQRQLERAIRARTRLVPGEGRAHIAPLRPREAQQVLGERVLVEYVEREGALAVVTLARGQPMYHELGSGDWAGELEWLGFALASLAGATGAAARAAAARSVEAAAAALDRLLVAPLEHELGDAELVLVPTGRLHALPWGALPSLRGRPVVVAPSLSLWLELARRPSSERSKTTLIAGPRLRHTTREVRELGALYRRPVTLHGPDATVEASLRALDGAALAHIACHGHFRSDSPLFSSLELADGPLNVYELQRLHAAPEVLVLSACDLAVSSLHPGDELLGLTAALIGLGTRTIVASVAPVRDSTARSLMLAFHRNLASGLPPAAALAVAQSKSPGAGFVCLGIG